MDINRIKQKHDIVQVVSRYMTLTKRGNKWIGLCPFHDDHHPSLTVDKNKQTFVCYACGERGDVIAFVQKKERCSFAEAITRLGGGNTKEIIPRAKPQPRMDTLPNHAELLPLLMPYSSGMAALSEAYLDFGVGIAPHRLPAAWKYLAGRIVFPLRDGEGVLCGFSGRTIQETKTCKYCNTSAAHGYNRNSFLYGLHRAKEAVRRNGTVFLAEGYKDVIAMHAAGFTHTVGVCGTELCEGQIDLLAAEVEKVILVADGDQPGQVAARKWQQQLELRGLEVVNISLPEGEDPDSLLHKWGKERFAAWVTTQVHRPHPTEDLLLYTVFAYPDSFTMAEGEKQYYTELIPALLEAEQLPLERAAGYSLLHHLSRGGTIENVPPELLPDWKDIEAKQQDFGIRLHKLFTGSDLLPGDIANLMVEGTLYIYLDTRLRSLVKGLVRDLQYEQSEAMRRQLCAALDYRRQQQEAIAYLLEYAPALAGGYYLFPS